MALRAVIGHPKFAHFKSLISRNKSATLGYLEGLWHFTGNYTPQGNLGKYTDTEIESWLEWDGLPGALISAYCDSRWVDRDPVHRLVVHDWPDHADQATKKSLGRKKLPFIRPVSVQCPDTGCTPYSRSGAGAGAGSGSGPGPDAGAGADADAESAGFLPDRAPPPKTPAAAPAAPHAMPTQPERQAAASLVQELAALRDAAGIPVGSQPKAIAAAAAQIAAHCSDGLPAFCSEMRSNHAACMPGWSAARAREPAGFVPFLSVWFSEGDCLRRPRAPADASDTTTGRPPVQTEFRTTTEYLRYKKARLTNAG